MTTIEAPLDGIGPVGSDERPASPRDVRIAIAATVVALLPVLMTVLAHAGREFVPGGDIAIIDLRVGDVFGGDLPLIGPYSRYGWNHPGPTMFYALAPLRALAGGAAWGTLVGGAILQGVAIALCARLAWRRGGVLLTVLLMTSISLAAIAVGDRLYIVPWNPHITFPFFALLVMQLWSVGVGDRGQLVGATIVGSFLVQTHVGYAPLVAAGALWAAAAIAIEARRVGTSLGTWLRPLTWSAGIAALLWLPPVVQQLSDTPGNLTDLATFARRGGGVGLRDGAGVLLSEFRFVPPWLGGTEATTPFTNAVEPASLWWAVVPLALFAIGARAGRRAGRRGRHVLVLLTLLGVLYCAAVIAVARADDPLDAYLFHWRALLATLLVAAVAYALIVLAGESLEGRTSLVLVGTFAVLLISSAGSVAWDVARPPVDPNPFAAEARILLRQLDDELPTRPFIVRNAASARRGISSALIGLLERRGTPVRVGRGERAVYGPERTTSKEDASAIWIVAEEGRDVSLLSDLSGARVLARMTPLEPADEAELVQRQRALADQLEAAGRPDLVPVIEYSALVHVLDRVSGIDREDVARVATLTKRAERLGGCRCAIVAFDPDVAPSLAIGETTSNTRT